MANPAAAEKATLTVSGVLEAVEKANDICRRTTALEGVRLAGNIGTGGHLIGPSFAAILKGQSEMNGSFGESDKVLRGAVVAGIGGTYDTWRASATAINLTYPRSFLSWNGAVHPLAGNTPAPVVRSLSGIAMLTDPDTLYDAMVKGLRDAALITSDLVRAFLKQVAEGAAQFFENWSHQQNVAGILASGPVPTYNVLFPEAAPVVGATATGFPFA